MSHVLIILYYMWLQELCFIQKGFTRIGFIISYLYSRDWKNFGCQALFRKSRILQINNFKTLILEYKLEQETENQLYVICEM